MINISRLLFFLSLLSLCLAECKQFDVDSPWGFRAYTKANCLERKYSHPKHESGDLKSVKCKNIKRDIKSFHMVSRNGCYVDVWSKPNCDQNKHGTPRSAPWYSTFWGHQDIENTFHWAKPSWWNSTRVNTKRHPVRSYRVYCPKKDPGAVKPNNIYY